MKVFEMPKMEVVRLMKEDIVRTSTCNDFTCPGTYTCNTCVECTPTYGCLRFFCSVHDCNQY